MRFRKRSDAARERCEFASVIASGMQLGITRMPGTGNDLVGVVPATLARMADGRFGAAALKEVLNC